MNLKITAATLLVAISLGACQQMQDNPKQTGGAILGGIGGGVAGAQFGKGKGQIATTILGTLAGAWLGSEIGSSLDKADRMYAERSATQALENNRAGQASTWRNPDSGHSGSFTPTGTYRSHAGEDCRTYETTIYVDGRPETANGRACRSPDGTWRIVE